MKNKRFFKESVKGLSELMDNFGLTIKDWCVSGEYAWILHGYDVSMREEHLDFYVRSRKLPWEKRDQIQTVPPKGSKELDLYCDYIEKYKMGLHMVPLPKPRVNENLIDKYAETISFEGIEFQVINPVGNLKDLAATLSAMTGDELGEERLIRWKSYMEQVLNDSSAKGDDVVAIEAKYILRKHLSSKKNESH